ncbi:MULTISPECIES: phage tail protein [unclassified Streptomyces]|uniref:phage tail protein n=1 Tax=unclassified Streptomyces TaxID=2593676 RepID=UPI0004CB576E|nr:MULTISPECIES: phage tail protein [unclassified Streptomyces]KOV86056.1 phage minor tail protein [Streptomyces sp. NRRL WC-3723]
MSDDVTITVRVNNQTAAGFRDINGNLRTLDGRFAASAGNMRRSSDGITRALVDVRASLLSLAPAAVPVAASLAPIAVQAGAAGAAVAAFGAAVIPQIANLSEAAKAQDKYSQAVQQYGAHSKQAVQAQQQAAQTLAGMPKATQQAAAAYSNLRDQFKAFSDSTARFTMQPVEHSFAVLGALLPKLRPMVEGTSTQLDRLVKVAGGGINTSGFDALSKKFSDFANQSLKGATDKAIHFMRVLSEGNVHGPLASFMDYARQQGPAVRELLSNLAEALGNVLEGAAQAGPGLLTLVNAFAKLVASVPPELIGNLMQVYAAIKLIKLAGAGVAGVAGGFQSLAARITALRAASAAAGGGIAGLRAAFLSLGTAAKASVVVAGLALLAVGIQKLAEKARGAPPDVDKLVTSLKGLADTGKFSGELKATFGSMDGFVAKVGQMRAESESLKKVKFLGDFGGLGAFTDTAVSKVDDLLNGTKSLGAVKDDLKSFDKAFAQLATGGHAKEAAKQFELFEDALKKAGYSTKDINKLFPEYKSAVADAKYEQELAAQSMGLFGTAAQAAATKLDQQKASADGLRGAIVSLNEAQRNGLGGMIGFEAAIDAAATAAKDNAGALSMSGGVLDLNSEKARNAATALQTLADKTDAAGTSQREAGASWETVNGIYTRGRAKLIEAAEAMGLNKEQAKQLAGQLLQMPTDVKPKVELEAEDAKADLTAFNAAIKKTPGTRKVTLETLSGAAEKVLESFGFKVKRLPNGKVQVTAKTGGALGAISNVAGALNNLDGKTATTYVTTVHQNKFTAPQKGGGPPVAKHDYASGGRVRGYADGGDVQSFPDGGYVQGPGSGTSDSILAFMGSGAVAAVSNTEYVVKAAAVRKYGVKMLDALNEGRLQVAGFAKGGHLSKAQQRARAQAQAEAQARSDARGDLTISHFGYMAGYRRSEIGNALGKPDSLGSLVSALNQWRNIIMKATHGSTESRLLKQLDSAGRSLLKWEKQLSSVTKSLEGAKSKLSDLKSASAQLAASVKGNLLSSTNITRGASGDSTVTLGSIQSGMRTSKDKVQAFATALKQLRAKGFSKSIIQQVAEAGIDGGGLETASALLQASASEVSTINATQAQIESAAGSAGKTTADAVYDKAIKAQERYVKSLEGQQKKLTQSMDKLGQKMEKAIESAFGKKASGGIVGAAASGGLRSGLTLVGEHGPELADLPMGSRVWSNPDTRRKLAAGQAPWASMLTAPRRTGAGAAPAAAGPAPVQPVVLELRSSGSHVDELLLQILRKAIRVRGGNVNFVLTGRS